MRPTLLRQLSLNAQDKVQQAIIEMKNREREFDELDEAKVEKIQLQEFLNRKSPEDAQNFMQSSNPYFIQVRTESGDHQRSLVEKLRLIDSRVQAMQISYKTVGEIFQEKYNKLKEMSDFREVTMQPYYGHLDRLISEVRNDTLVMGYIREVVKRRNPYLSLQVFLEELEKKLQEDRDFVHRNNQDILEEGSPDEADVIMKVFQICDRCLRIQ